MASHMNNYPQALPNSYMPYNMPRAPPRVLQNNAVPPPVPPRPGQSYYSDYNRMGNDYSRFGSGSMYSPYSRYSSGMFPSAIGGYRTPFNRYGSPFYDGGVDNSIIQLAEESTRPAFQSIESVVEAVSSISMMLDSTYHAVHSSYSAILGVVENFSRLKDHLAQMLSLLALLRGLRWLCLKVLYLLGLRRTNPSAEAAWSAATQAANGTSSGVNESDPKQSAWPILIFMGLVFGAPWLIFRLFAKKAVKKVLDPSLWLNEKGAQIVAVAMYDFNSARPQELSFRAGQKLLLAPKNLQSKTRGWILASLDGKNSGLAPANYLGMRPSPSATKIVVPSQQASLQPLATSIDSAFDFPSPVNPEQVCLQPLDTTPDSTLDFPSGNSSGQASVQPLQAIRDSVLNVSAVAPQQQTQLEKTSPNSTVHIPAEEADSSRN